MVVELGLKSHLDHPLPKDLHGLVPFSAFIQLLKASGSGLKTELKPIDEEEKGGISIICLYGGWKCQSYFLALTIYGMNGGN